MVFQEFDQLPPWKTVKQNVMFPLLASRAASRAEAEERALHYLNKVGLARFVKLLTLWEVLQGPRELSLAKRLWQQGWLRKGLFC